MKNLSLALLLGLVAMSVEGYSQAISTKKINSKTPASTTSTSRATAISKQDLKPSEFSVVFSVARYYQYQLYEGKSPEQTLDFVTNPVFVNQNLKFTSLFVYSHNETNPQDSSMDDAIFNLSSIPKNINSALKGRYYLTGTAGLSKVSREEKGQYGTFGPGVGLLMDSEKLKIPWMSLATSLSLSKAFQKQETTTKGDSNSNWVSLSTTALGFTKNSLAANFVFMFINSLKYNDDYSNVYLVAQEAGYNFSKNFALFLGHVNKTKTLDQTTGDLNIQILNNETSYFYLRFDVTL